VHARDAYWYEKHHQAEIEAEKAKQAADDEAHGGIHMPSNSWFPVITASGMLIGSLFFCNHNFIGAIGGLVIVFFGAWMWSVEGPGGYHLHPTKEGSDNADAQH
jgi:cytochrome c oxidase subunit 1